ncbi:MAG: sensor histidine kinase, partial [Spirochaetia bacterium]|nr:sensor histidine kinase [Spirochaetia bacterium]
MNCLGAFLIKRTLFTRLLLYFLVVLIVPLALFASYYALIGGRNQELHLMEQAKQNAMYDAQQVGSVLESYRHKAYQLSTNELVISILKEDRIETNSQTSRNLYQLLFSTMRGDTYLASAHLVSNSGKVRVSTHVFPDVFDLRYHSNDYDMNSIISQNPNVSPTASIISIRGHRQAESNRMVIATILRRVYDKEGNNLGYLVVEVFSEALSSVLSTNESLSDILLVDNIVYIASSLRFTDRSGPFTTFPALTSLKSIEKATVQRAGSSILAIETIPGTDLLLAAVVSSIPYQESFDRLLLIFTGTMAVGTLLAMMLSFLFSRSISQPISDLATRMAEVEKGNLQKHEVTSTIFEFAQLEHSFNVMVKQIAHLLELTKEEQKKLNEAERKALESQMNPHFLFNTLNTIKALAKLH